MAMQERACTRHAELCPPCCSPGAKHSSQLKVPPTCALLQAKRPKYQPLLPPRKKKEAKAVAA